MSFKTKFAITCDGEDCENQGPWCDSLQGAGRMARLRGWEVANWKVKGKETWGNLCPSCAKDNRPSWWPAAGSTGEG